MVQVGLEMYIPSQCCASTWLLELGESVSRGLLVMSAEVLLGGRNIPISIASCCISSVWLCVSYINSTLGVKIIAGVRSHHIGRLDLSCKWATLAIDNSQDRIESKRQGLVVFTLP